MIKNLRTGNLVVHPLMRRPLRVTGIEGNEIRLDYPGNSEGPVTLTAEKILHVRLTKKLLFQIGFGQDAGGVMVNPMDRVYLREALDKNKIKCFRMVLGYGTEKVTLDKEFLYALSDLQNRVIDVNSTILSIEDEKIDLNGLNNDPDSYENYWVNEPSISRVPIQSGPIRMGENPDYYFIPGRGQSKAQCAGIANFYAQEAVIKQQKLDRCYLKMAFIWAENSHAKRRQVGSIIVKDGMIISDGYNGTPHGFDNCCEDENNKTLPCVLHAEANAITKLAKFGGASSKGSIIYITDEPCVDCAKLIIQAGIQRVVYCREYRMHAGIELLEKAKVQVDHVELEDAPEVPCP